MHLFTEKGILDGISTLINRFVKSKNPQCPDYDNSKPNNLIIYLDANNLYGWARN